MNVQFTFFYVQQGVVCVLLLWVVVLTSRPAAASIHQRRPCAAAFTVTTFSLLPDPATQAHPDTHALQYTVSVADTHTPQHTTSLSLPDPFTATQTYQDTYNTPQHHATVHLQNSFTDNLIHPHTRAKPSPYHSTPSVVRDVGEGGSSIQPLEGGPLVLRQPEEKEEEEEGGHSTSTPLYTLSDLRRRKRSGDRGGIISRSSGKLDGW